MLRSIAALPGPTAIGNPAACFSRSGADFICNVWNASEERAVPLTADKDLSQISKSGFRLVSTGTKWTGLWWCDTMTVIRSVFVADDGWLRIPGRPSLHFRESSAESLAAPWKNQIRPTTRTFTNVAENHSQHRPHERSEIQCSFESHVREFSRAP